MCDSFAFSSEHGGYSSHPPAGPSGGNGYGYGYGYTPASPASPAYGYGPGPGPGMNNYNYGHGYDPSPGPPPPPPSNNFNYGINNTSTNGPPQPQNPSSGPKTFHIRTSPQTSQITLIHALGHHPFAPPLYSLTISPKNSSADIALYRGAETTNPIAEVHSHTFSSKLDIIVRGTSMVLKESGSLGDKYKIEIPQMGIYKWVAGENSATGSKMDLRDEGGNVIARHYKSKSSSSFLSGPSWKKMMGGGGRDKKVQIMVPCSDFFVEVVIISAFAARQALGTAIESAGDMISTVLGA